MRFRGLFSLRLFVDFPLLQPSNAATAPFNADTPVPHEIFSEAASMLTIRVQGDFQIQNHRILSIFAVAALN